MSNYHLWASTPDGARALADKRNEGSPYEAYHAEYHKAQCPHATEGWFAVYRNEQGNMWDGAPWEKCWPCRREEETVHYTLRDVAGNRLDIHLKSDGKITFIPDPSYTGSLTFKVEDIRQMFSEILLETE